MNGVGITGSPLKWHGGKAYLAGKICELMESLPIPHTHYVEPYGGSLAVLFERNPEYCSEVVNDLHQELMNFWNVLKDPCTFIRFVRYIQATPFSEQTWQTADTLRKHGVTSIDRALGFFIACRQSRAGCFDSFATLSRTRIRRGMNEQVSAWLTALEGLPNVHARLQRVVLLNRPALDVIRQQDGPKTLFYLDPPYLHATRTTIGQYDYEMTDEQHTDLLLLLTQIQGKFLLSGYPNEMYDSYANRYNWQVFDFDLPNNAAGGDEKRRMTERVWCKI
jgi:DNA adenine methylase